MTLEIRTGEDLAATAPSRLVADWLRGGTPLGAAADELIRVSTLPPRTAPWFSGGGPAAWVATMHAELPTAGDRARFDADREALSRGAARVVVAGQQPGYAGGPLLTVHKLTTAVALARRETAVGRPTVPVFWLGDDDDDVREALETKLWDPADGSLLDNGASLPVAAGGLPPQRLGTFPLEAGHDAVAPWLERFADPRDELGLAALWSRASAGDATWSSFVRQALLRIFTGEGLMIVSGDDPVLHDTAGPFYRELMRRREELAALVRRRGGELAGRNWHAQIHESSLKRPLFRARNKTRVALERTSESETTADLRPGVMLRSPVQDWLLAPAAVIVGPGEAAYLRQLDPVYEALGLGRSPLVYRMSVCLLPLGLDRSFLRVPASDMVSRGDGTPAWLDTWLDSTTESLTRLLEQHLGQEERAAGRTAQQRTRRWRRGLAAMVANETKRQERLQPPATPAWVQPTGGTQERRLAWLGALALWGAPLRDTLLVAAERHLVAGAAGHWRQLEITVDEPEDSHERQD
ncbi:MAG: bacillithiol biosynthesis BshC [bacterium]|nr:bacillithiol biosynthesis BshC [bacterium]